MTGRFCEAAKTRHTPNSVQTFHLVPLKMQGLVVGGQVRGASVQGEILGIVGLSLKKWPCTDDAQKGWACVGMSEMGLHGWHFNPVLFPEIFSSLQSSARTPPFILALPQFCLDSVVSFCPFYKLTAAQETVGWRKQ